MDFIKLKNLICKILNYFGYANDWVDTWEESGVTMKGTKQLVSTYAIQLSPSLGKYRLIIGGHKPKDHPVHRIAAMHLINLNKTKNG